MRYRDHCPRFRAMIEILAAPMGVFDDFLDDDVKMLIMTLIILNHISHLITYVEPF